MLLVKSTAAAVALRLISLPWPAAIGMGLGLAQLGEFSFLLLAEGMAQGVISDVLYNRMLFISLGTLILTPQLLKLGLRWTSPIPDEHAEEDRLHEISEPTQHALVIGVGPIGRQIASRLETMGVDVCVLDLSPINLHAFGQQGFHTVAGDARDQDVLRKAHVERQVLCVVSVPDDDIANQIVVTARELNPRLSILVRCRFQSNIERTMKAGALDVVSEEAEASGALLRRCEAIVGEPATLKGDHREAEPVTH